MRILITGGCGFLGSNLAIYGMNAGHEVSVFDNLSKSGSIENLQWLKSNGLVDFINGDIRNSFDVSRAINSRSIDAIFHLAGQVAMTTSIDNPRFDFEVNALGTFNVLDAVRQKDKNIAVIYSSTNKVYGDLEQYKYSETPTRYTCEEYPNGFDENVGLSFHSPYGTSKGSADQYMLDFARIFGLKTVVFRHSSMYGGRQFATYDQGWIGWFCHCAIQQKKNPNAEPFTISGNGKQVRDILYSEDMNCLYYTVLENIDKMKGNAYNIGGGFENSLSLLELFDILEKELNVKLNYKCLPPRESDQRVFVADIGKVSNACGWTPKVDKLTGIRKMINWVKNIND